MYKKSKFEIKLRNACKKEIYSTYDEETQRNVAMGATISGDPTKTTVANFVKEKRNEFADITTWHDGLADNDALTTFIQGILGAHESGGVSGAITKIKTDLSMNDSQANVILTAIGSM